MQGHSEDSDDIENIFLLSNAHVEILNCVLYRLLFEQVFIHIPIDILIQFSVTSGYCDMKNSVQATFDRVILGEMTHVFNIEQKSK